MSILCIYVLVYWFLFCVRRKLLFEIQSLRDDKDALKRQVKEHLVCYAMHVNRMNG